MKTYHRRISTNPDVYRDIEAGDRVHKDYIKTKYPNGCEISEYWQGGAPVVTPPTHTTRLKAGQIIALLKDPSNASKGSYAKIYRAAYGNGGPTKDDRALEFLEQAQNPYSEDGLIAVSDIDPDLDYFITKNYIDQDDKDRVMQGWPL